MKKIVNFFVGLFEIMLNMKFLGFIVLVTTLFCSLFKVAGADLDNNVLGVALMVLLLSLFSDLKEFNFWGLTGKKQEKQLKELKDEQGLSDKKKPNQHQAQPESPQMIQLMDTKQGNFLMLAFEIERLLRDALNLLEKNSSFQIYSPDLISKKLLDLQFLSESGVKQVEAIRWLRNMLVHGRSSEVSDQTLTDGIALAFNLYKEIYNWFNPQSTK